MAHTTFQSPRRDSLNALNQRCAELCKQLGAERKRGRELKELAKNREVPDCFKPPLEERTLKQLEECVELLKNLRDKVNEEIAKRSAEKSAAPLSSSANDVGMIDLNVAIEDDEA